MNFYDPKLQLWIAEGAGPFVYVSMAGFPRLENDTLCSPHIGSTSIIKQCSFNHPDKAYVCTNEDQRLIFAGKIGVSEDFHCSKEIRCCNSLGIKL